MVVSNFIQLFAIGEIHRGILRQIITHRMADLDGAFCSLTRRINNLSKFVVEIGHYHFYYTAHIVIQTVNTINLLQSLRRCNKGEIILVAHGRRFENRLHAINNFVRNGATIDIISALYVFRWKCKRNGARCHHDLYLAQFRLFVKFENLEYSRIQIGRSNERGNRGETAVR